MTRAEQHKKMEQVIAMYQAGRPTQDILDATGYTQARIYQILKAQGAPTHRQERINDNPDIAKCMPMIRRQAEALRALSNADKCDARPELQLSPDMYKHLGCLPGKQKQLQKFLKSLGMMLWETPYPALYDLKNNRYFRLTYREVIFLHNDPAGWLREAAPRIKAGWITGGKV